VPGTTILADIPAGPYNAEESQPDTPMRPFANHKPLSDAEFERLGAFLGKRKNPKAMNVEELDGFFTALVCGPELVPPSEYSPHIYGGEASFESIEEAQEIIGLVMRHWNTIAGTLYAGKVYLPFLCEDENGIARGNGWAKGFLRGMELRRQSWSKLLDDERHGGSLVPILALAHEHDPDPKLRPGPITPEQRESLLTHLRADIVLIYRYFRPGRSAHARV
jgi:uncharacterized protein